MLGSGRRHRRPPGGWGLGGAVPTGPTSADLLATADAPSGALPTGRPSSGGSTASPPDAAPPSGAPTEPASRWPQEEGASPGALAERTVLVHSPCYGSVGGREREGVGRRLEGQRNLLKARQVNAPSLVHTSPITGSVLVVWKDPSRSEDTVATEKSKLGFSGI